MAYNYKKTFNENQQDWRINSWMSKHGISAQDLEKHPQIDSVIKLVNVRDYLWERMNASERGVWAAYWGWVYTQKKPLKKKFWTKMTVIVRAIDQREQIKIVIKQRRNK